MFHLSNDERYALKELINQALPSNDETSISSNEETSIPSKLLTFHQMRKQILFGLDSRKKSGKVLSYLKKLKAFTFLKQNVLILLNSFCLYKM